MKVTTKMEVKKAAVLKKRDAQAGELPDFWKTAFSTFAAVKLSGVFDDGDEAALEDLEKVEVERDASDARIITVRMTFADNKDSKRSFKNKVLVKKVTVNTDHEDESDGVVHERTKLEIAPAAKGGNAKGDKKRTEPEPLTFFHFFEDDQCSTVMNLVSFYEDAHRYYLGEIPMDDDMIFDMLGGEDGDDDGEDGDEGEEDEE